MKSIAALEHIFGRLLRCFRIGVILISEITLKRVLVQLSLSRKVSQDDGATLGVILKELERSKKLHPALRSAFSSLYGYTSDADGIRHALLDAERLTKADARFMLVCCSAFVNYVVESVS